MIFLSLVFLFFLCLFLFLCISYYIILLSQLAAEHRYRYRKEMTAVDQPTSLNLFDEDVYNAMDDKGHIVRKDMFKGTYHRSCSFSFISCVEIMHLFLSLYSVLNSFFALFFLY